MLTKLQRLPKKFSSKFFSTVPVNSSFKWKPSCWECGRIKPIDVLAILLQKPSFFITDEDEWYPGPSRIEYLLMSLSNSKPEYLVKTYPLSVFDGYGGPDNTHYIKESAPFIETALMGRFPEIAKQAQVYDKLVTNLETNLELHKQEFERKLHLFHYQSQEQFKKVLGEPLETLNCKIQFKCSLSLPKNLASIISAQTEERFGSEVVFEPLTPAEIEHISEQAKKIPPGKKAILCDSTIEPYVNETVWVP